MYRFFVDKCIGTSKGTIDSWLVQTTRQFAQELTEGGFIVAAGAKLILSVHSTTRGCPIDWLPSSPIAGK